MSFKHGVYSSEVPTSIVPPSEAMAGLPVVVGTAPIHLAKSPAVNKPVLCYEYKEAVEYLGYSDNWEAYTLCEFVKSQFTLFSVAPVVFINVLDPVKHKKSIVDEVITLEGKEGIIKSAVLLDTLTLKDSGEQVLVKDTDYVASFNDNGEVLLTILKAQVTGTVKASFTEIDPSLVTANDIIGGIDEAGKSTGLELINEVLSRFALIPGQIVAPGWSDKPEVAAVMVAKATIINSFFKCIAITDIPVSECPNYGDVAAWKNENNYTYKNQISCWPKVRLGSAIYHLSTQIAGLNCKTDSEFDGVPYVSPSNRSLQMNGLVGKDGEEIALGIDQANYLNGQGIMTAINFYGGWKAWGNRTAIYPSSTDPKDCFIPVRRMFDWVGNTIIQTFWSKVDGPMTPRLVDTILDSLNLWLNGLSASGALLGGRVVWLEGDNPVTSLMDGKMKFHVYLTPPSPAEELDFVLEYDVEYIKTLFA